MKKRKVNNKRMAVLTVVVMMITAVFLTSKLWLPDDRRIMSVDKVVLHNRTFTKMSERYDDVLLEIRLEAEKLRTQYEQAPLLERYDEITVTINNKRNKAQFIILYNELLNKDELLIQVPYIDFVSSKDDLYYVEIKFDTGVVIRSDYRRMTYIPQIKEKDDGYSTCLFTQEQYDVTLAEYEQIDVNKAVDEIQRKAIEKAIQEQQKMLEDARKELGVCLERYGV